MISIWIPVYNGEEYIGRAIKSALNQTYKDIEVLVFDDASTDRTEEEVKKHDVRYYRTKERLGFTRSTVKIIELCKGEYVHLLSHDDTIPPDFIEELARSFEKYPDAGAVLPVCLSIENGIVTNSISMSKEIYTRNEFYNLVYRHLIHDLILWGLVRREDALRAARKHVGMVNNPPEPFPEQLRELMKHEYGHGAIISPLLMENYDYLVCSNATYMKTTLPEKHYIKNKGSMKLRMEYGLDKSPAGIRKRYNFQKIMFAEVMPKKYVKKMKRFMDIEANSTVFIEGIKGFNIRIIPRLIQRFISYLRR